MDYKSLGLKCGLEIHQQLDTAKLFCRCPSTLRDDKAHFAVTRMLRAVQGESGIIDIAALHEQKKGNVFVYEGHDTNCLVELDEEPPHALNSEALSAALEAALLLNAKVVDAIQVMRKTVVDGSNTSGFQRTALIAENGAIATDSGNVSIRTVCIEEDSARSVSTESGRITYRLDRLGTPLIEIATGAEIYSPKQCKEVAEYIGMILRSTGKVKRGIGTIRQDVNVSIARGARVEIKGAQELKMLPLLVENEAKRQLALLELHQGLKKREAVATSVLDCSELFKKTQSTLVKNALDKKQAVLGMKLAGCAGLIGKELLPGLRFGTELSDHAKMCGVGGIFHSDELPKYGITADEVAALRKKFGCRADDGFVIVVADAHRANRALDAVADRLNQAIHGVPEEVRRAEQDGTTRFLRPIPTAARMYPETDIPLIFPEVKGIQLPELIDHKVERFVKLGLSKDLATLVAKSERVELFEELVKHDVKAAFIAEVLTARVVELRREFNVDVTDDHLRQAIELLDKGKVTKEVLSSVLVDMVKGQFDEKKHQAVGKKDIEKELKAIIAANKGAPFGALMGIAVGKLKGKASGKEIAELLGKLMR